MFLSINLPLDRAKDIRSGLACIPSKYGNDMQNMQRISVRVTKVQVQKTNEQTSTEMGLIPLESQRCGSSQTGILKKVVHPETFLHEEPNYIIEEN